MKSRAGPTDEGRKLAQEPWTWRKAVLASPYTVGVKLGGIAIAEFVNKKSAIAFAKYSTIGKSCGMAPRTIRHAHDVLSRAGFFGRVRRRFQDAVEIYLTLPEPGVTVMSMTGRAKPKPARRCQSKRHGDAKVSGTAMPDIEEPTTEPTNEPSTKKAIGEGKPSEIVGSFDSSVDNDRLPDLTYGRMEPPRGIWLPGLVSNQDPVFGIFLTASASLKFSELCSEVDGVPVQEWIMRQFPAAVLAEMTKRCVAGNLSRRCVEMAALALKIPAYETIEESRVSLHPDKATARAWWRAPMDDPVATTAKHDSDSDSGDHPSPDAWARNLRAANVEAESEIRRAALHTVANVDGLDIPDSLDRRGELKHRAA